MKCKVNVINIRCFDRTVGGTAKMILDVIQYDPPELKVNDTFFIVINGIQ